jgi:O-antigen/teichoic acid export membrane protein
VRPWSSWDYSYCGKFVAATLFANQLGAIDILVAGMLFPSEAVADYAVASRIAALYVFFQLAILKRFAPRAGSLLEKSDLPALRQEVELCRNLMIGCCALNISGLLLVAPFILPLFGNYAAAQTFLIWLAVPTFVQSFYAASDRLLIMAGQANVLLMLTASSFLVLTTAPFLTASWLGMTSIPSAMIVSALLFNPMVARRARKLFDVRTVRLRDFVVLAGGAGALAAYAALGSMQMRLMACGLLAGIGALSLRAAIRTAGKQGAAIYQLGDDQARTGCRPSMELLPDKQAR